jgi:hypothetical protein
MNAPHRLAVTLMLLLLAGCSRQGSLNGPGNPATGASPDQADVASAVAANPSLVDDEVSESPERTSITGSASASAAATLGVESAIQPVTFWREIRDIERRFEFAFSDTDSTGRPKTAVVTVHKRFTGSFNILVADQVPEGSPPQSHVIRKPLVDHWVRRLLLRRVRVLGSERPAWRVVATSGVQITSRDAQTRIASLRVQSGTLDTTITEPLAFFRLRRIIQLDPLAEVTLTATTLGSDDVVLLYLRDHRVRFHNNGDGTYNATFQVPDRTALHHVGVNALSNGTLFDDQARYDSQAWIEPYLVHPLELAEGTPLE